jgi:hypothetical protein
MSGVGRSGENHHGGHGGDTAGRAEVSDLMTGDLMTCGLWSVATTESLRIRSARCVLAV